ncbi:MAG: FkbM family methyltransferase [bacterium]|nr:FkbM family methyltransferase [bacterium]
MNASIGEHGMYAPSWVMECVYRAMNWIYGCGYVGRRAFGRLQWFERRFLASRDDVVDVERYGLRWRLHKFGNVSESRLLRRPDTFESEEIEFVLGLAVDDFVFIDVGANCGYWSLRVANQLAGSGLVIAIEPQPAMLERLRYNAKANGIEFAGVHECVVGEGAGRALLELDERNLGRSRVSECGSLEVEVKSLLEIADSHDLGRVDAIKVDVEGYEDRVLGPFLRNADDALLPRVIVAECSWSGSWEDDWLTRAQERRYREVRRTRNHNVILVRDG